MNLWAQAAEEGEVAGELPGPNRRVVRIVYHQPVGGDVLYFSAEERHIGIGKGPGSIAPITVPRDISTSASLSLSSMPFPEMLTWFVADF